MKDWANGVMNQTAHVASQQAGASTREQTSVSKKRHLQMKRNAEQYMEVLIDSECF